MTGEEFQNCEENFRRAVAERRFQAAEALARVYCDSALVYLASLEPGDPRIPEIGAHVKDVLSWAHLVLLTARAAIAAPLPSLSLVSRYLVTPPTPSRTGFQG